MKVLFVCSEAYPLIKTGGLGDVGGALPRALLKAGAQVRLLLPAYKSLLAKAKERRAIAIFACDGSKVTLWQTRLPGSRVLTWLVDIPEFSERDGGPYGDDQGQDWIDNPKRFYILSRVAQMLACGEINTDFKPEIVHCHDWQTGLVPALLRYHNSSVATVFTIHNLAYRGVFNYATFEYLNLPPEWWHFESLEFWDHFSYLKAGLVYADKITTVSPSYAEEIQTEAFGHGFEGLLQHRRADLSGIINGIDTETWNPGADDYLERKYTRRSIKRRAENKQALQQQLGLPVDPEIPLLGFVGRLVEQKGVSLILEALTPMLERSECQLVAVGTGQKDLEAGLAALAERFPDKASATIGYSEPLSHRVEAGCDIFLMPSLFEPCGLNQMYSQRYGAVPVCHYVGGLRDTVINFCQTQLDAWRQGSLTVDEIDETGFLFNQPTAPALTTCLERALACYHEPELWRRLQLNGMHTDFSWQQSCEGYMELYRGLLE
ncbi:glycogen synthase GlgA [Gilvimarinus xylanilyticus]|uniref:Glycogen synthase n=1 Tax=Gilvimarinus xylanilyticus TaxID=2944139 RepID=A0A9X2I3T8_9GAMM|nr:glycogen synthase GlgA [Gilvimarinus xylanilyticus]MCP8898442.1 glycogen synthase GlgA [Gilvimarinus xylanilyticus]